MYGSNIKTLKIVKIEGASKVSLLELNGAKGNNWQNFDVDLPKGGPYKVAKVKLLIYNVDIKNNFRALKNSLVLCRES